ncbi:hypothetical protein D3C72_1648750 [compost metagenome]
MRQLAVGLDDIVSPADGGPKLYEFAVQELGQTMDRMARIAPGQIGGDKGVGEVEKAVSFARPRHHGVQPLAQDRLAPGLKLSHTHDSWTTVLALEGQVPGDARLRQTGQVFSNIRLEDVADLDQTVPLIGLRRLAKIDGGIDAEARLAAHQPSPKTRLNTTSTFLVW